MLQLLRPQGAGSLNREESAHQLNENIARPPEGQLVNSRQPQYDANGETILRPLEPLPGIAFGANLPNSKFQDLPPQPSQLTLGCEGLSGRILAKGLKLSIRRGRLHPSCPSHPLYQVLNKARSLFNLSGLLVEQRSENGCRFSKRCRLTDAQLAALGPKALDSGER